MGYWEKVYLELLAEAKRNYDTKWNVGQVIVIRTHRGNIYTVRIPDFMDPSVREPLENECIKTLKEQQDTHVLHCLATVNGIHPEICSWNFRSRLIALNPDNLHTEIFLWGGDYNIHVKSFANLLPPGKS